MIFLAKWAMQSRSKAILATAICFAIPLMFWAGAALTALILLRQGWNEGRTVVFWAILPALGWLSAGDPTPLVVGLGTGVAALVLRESIRMDLAMLMSALLGMVMYWVLPLTLADVLPLVIEHIEEVAAGALSDEPGVLAQVHVYVSPMIVGILAAMHVLVLALCLLLGRYWQSVLYNPGGFGREFKEWRLPLVYAVPVALSVISASQLHPDLVGILPLLTVPMFLAGLSMFHGVVMKTSASSNWMFPIYIGLVLFGPYMYTLLIFVAVVDSLVDVRSRLKDTASGDQ